MKSTSSRSLRRAYVDWVEEQIEEFKDTIPRSQLLQLADEVVTGLRVDKDGQYQLTEILLCNAMDRRIFRMLKLPGYRAWCAHHQAEEPAPSVITFPLPERFALSTAPMAATAAEYGEGPGALACVG
ncbi:hypothetical protein [Longimicrobium terrae]|uniref:Uncharacterized protein n=1 Tax=Longimicrobium terrae TaxID=1639882 RepID=A0A841GRT1_9BACT|nr:hypothetical protein [Longimicrobium terrae]MBB4634111.1 hypothetical protein [Longimicrobium terrae]MBB6068999.1 hypothetical protein [Longimicrobium terrae]NNC28177.1 hypothetical protein [Longimicrobium terrae]